MRSGARSARRVSGRILGFRKSGPQAASATQPGAQPRPARGVLPVWRGGAEQLRRAGASQAAISRGQG